MTRVYDSDDMPGEGAPSEVNRICKNCGADISATSNYCDYCGIHVDEAA